LADTEDKAGSREVKVKVEVKVKGFDVQLLFLLLSQEEYPDPPVGGRGEVVCFRLD
jgi:hypothetical protein